LLHVLPDEMQFWHWAPLVPHARSELPPRHCPWALQQPLGQVCALHEVEACWHEPPDCEVGTQVSPDVVQSLQVRPRRPHAVGSVPARH
jgi:hypothetical protein